MGKEIEVVILSKEIVKPSSPTAQHLRTLQLSFLDQLASIHYITFVLFYPNTQNNDANTMSAEKSQLKKSLSDTLTHFHPLAGWLEDNASINCNDDRAEFVAAQVNCPVSKVLGQPNMEIF